MVTVVPKSVSGVHEVRERFRPDAMLLDLHVVREIFKVRNLTWKASGFRYRLLWFSKPIADT